MEINFLIGGKNVKQYYDDLLNTKQIMLSLNDEINFKENDNMLYIDNSMFVNLNEILKRYKLMHDDQKVFLILRYASKNYCDEIYLYMKNIDFNFMKLFFHYVHYNINIFYKNKKDIKDILHYKNIKLKKINKEEMYEN